MKEIETAEKSKQQAESDRTKIKKENHNKNWTTINLKFYEQHSNSNFQMEFVLQHWTNKRQYSQEEVRRILEWINITSYFLCSQFGAISQGSHDWIFDSWHDFKQPNTHWQDNVWSHQLQQQWHLVKLECSLSLLNIISIKKCFQSYQNQHLWTINQQTSQGVMTSVSKKGDELYLNQSKRFTLIELIFFLSRMKIRIFWVGIWVLANVWNYWSWVGEHVSSIFLLCWLLFFLCWLFVFSLKFSLTFSWRNSPFHWSELWWPLVKHKRIFVILLTLPTFVAFHWMYFDCFSAEKLDKSRLIKEKLWIISLIWFQACKNNVESYCHLCFVLCHSMSQGPAQLSFFVFVGPRDKGIEIRTQLWLVWSVFELKRFCFFAKSPNCIEFQQFFGPKLTSQKKKIETTSWTHLTCAFPSLSIHKLEHC